jgi:predicted protein tyrosine phosphatase
MYANFYLSDLASACKIKTLHKNKIKAILFLGCNNKKEDILEKYKHLGISHLFIHINDNNIENINWYSSDVFEFINSNIKHNILIHCHKGISRSPVFLTMYLLNVMYSHKKYNTSQTRNILDFFTKQRHCVLPNKNFINQLITYEKSLSLKIG